MYRLITESMLGLKRNGPQLILQPNLPAKWNALEIDYRFGEATYRIRVMRDGQARSTLEVDGVMQDDMTLALAPTPAVHDVILRVA
jgi:cyclic beta-1,2-glucan synthetase